MAEKAKHSATQGGLFGRVLEWIVGLREPFVITPPDHPVFREVIANAEWLRYDPRSQAYEQFFDTFKFALGFFAIFLLYASLMPSSFPLSILIAIVSICAIPVWLLTTLLTDIDSLHQIYTCTHDIWLTDWTNYKKTMMPLPSVLTAIHAGLQICSWRNLNSEITSKVLVACGYCAMFFTLASLDRWSSTSIFSGLDIIFFFVLIFAICLKEPVWRMRALTAFGLALSTFNLKWTFIAPISFITYCLVHTAQIFGFLATLGFSFYLLDSRREWAWALSALLFYVANWAFFWLIRTLSLRFTLRVAFRDWS